MTAMRYREERDSMGIVKLPADALWGATTQRAIANFPISGRPMPAELIHAYGVIKAACAKVNRDLGLLPAGKARAEPLSRSPRSCAVDNPAPSCAPGRFAPASSVFQRPRGW